MNLAKIQSPSCPYEGKKNPTSCRCAQSHFRTREYVEYLVDTSIKGETSGPAIKKNPEAGYFVRRGRVVVTGVGKDCVSIYGAWSGRVLLMYQLVWDISFVCQHTTYPESHEKAISIPRFAQNTFRRSSRPTQYVCFGCV